MYKIFLRHSRFFWIVLLYTVTSISSHGSDINFSPSYVFNVQRTPFLHNCAHYSEKTTEFTANYQALKSSPTSDRNMYIAGKNNFSPSNSIGFIFLNEATSDFFQRNRFYGVIQHRIQINRETWMSAGMQLGVVNFSMHSLGFSAGGADTQLDFGLGLHIQNEKYQLGFAMDQINEPTLRPIIYTFELTRVIEAYGNYSIEIIKNIIYTPEIRVRIGGSRDYYSLSQMMSFDDRFGILANYLHQKGVSVMAFFNTSPNDSKYSYEIFLSYFSPITNQKFIDAEQIEIGLNLSIN